MLDSLDQFILRIGGKLTLSDDAHGPLAVGAHYADVFAYLQRMKVDTLWYLDEAKDEEDTKVVLRRMLVARQVQGNWQEDDFWKRLG